MDFPDETYRQYYEDIGFTVDWDEAAQVVLSGEPSAEFFTLPWWQIESNSFHLYGADYNKKRLTEL